jgi:hypothetical protein
MTKPKPSAADIIRNAIKLLERAAFELSRPHAVKKAARPKPRLIRPPDKKPTPRKPPAKMQHEEEF